MTLTSLIPKLYGDTGVSRARSGSPWDTHSDIERLFDEFFEGSGLFPAWLKTESQSNFTPKVEYRERENEVEYRFELPGLEDKDVSLELENGVLRLSGEKRSEASSDDDDLHATELCYGSFVRELTLPQDVNVDKAKARFRNGILSVSVPKLKPAKPNRRKVEIKAA